MVAKIKIYRCIWLTYAERDSVAHFFDLLLMCSSIMLTKYIASSNENEVIKAVLNFLFIYLFFLQKDFAHTKSTKSTKTQPSKSTKRYRKTKIKNALKKHLRGKVAYSLICVFVLFVRAKKKKIEKRRNSPQCKRTKYRCPHN